jgi:hypothetical protein
MCALLKATLMITSKFRRPLWVLAGALLLIFSSLAAAEPPSRAARLGYLRGTVSFSPAGEPDWVRAAVNRPLTSGDRLWTGNSSRAELQIGGAAIRMGPSTSMVLLNLDNRIAQVQLSQGSLKIRVRSLGPRQTLEVATPNLAFSLRRPGEYRIEVDPRDDATAVIVNSGAAEVYGEDASYTVDSSRAYRFYGTDLSDYETLNAQRDDELDRWSRERDRRAANSVSARYVSSEVVGYEDLDNNGSWRVDATYGSVWTPTQVTSGWSPYSDGHWSWIDPWGWTWVDDAPWGYAVSHYGRWAHIDDSWSWVPGPRRERAVYAPALVAFIGGTNFQVSVSVGGTSPANVGWFPLAPREVYQPSYPVSRNYFDRINRSNAVIAPSTITTVYNTTIVNNTTNVTQVTNVIYANQRVAGAVIAVPTQAFVQSQPVAPASVRVARDVVVSAPVVRVAGVAPVRQSVHGGAPEALTRPPEREHAFVVRTAPPPAPVPFAAQQPQLAARPGRPIDEEQRTQFRPAAPAVLQPKVSVVAPEPRATARPPATAPAGRSPQAREADASRRGFGPGESRRPDADKAAGAQADAARAEAARGDAAQAGMAEAAQVRAAQAKADAARAEAVKAEAVRAEAARSALEKADAARAESARADASKAAAARAATDTAAASKAAADRAEAADAADARANASRAFKAKADAGKADAARADATRAERARAQAAQAEATKVDAMQAQAARAEAARAATARAESAKDEAAKAEAKRAEAAKVALARAEAAKAEAGKADAARAARAGARGERTNAGRSAVEAKPPAAAAPPGSRASDSKPDADASVDDEKRKPGRRP